MPIVIADDHPQVRNLIKCMLSNHGFAVIEAEDGLDAFAVIRKLDGRVSALVSDICIPHFDGVALCRAVKETYPSIPIVLMPGNAEPGNSNTRDAFLRKPFVFVYWVGSPHRCRRASRTSG